MPPKKQPARLPIYTYAYDAAGNRIRETLGNETRTAAYNALNQLLARDDAEFRYDPEGNLSERQSARLGDRRYLWDAENRLLAVEDLNDPATRSAFRYDALGRRIAVRDQVDGRITRDARLLYCGLTLCGADPPMTGGFSRYYAEGELRDGEARYHHHDHLGSVRLVTDPSGAVTAAHGYDPYGRQTVLHGAADDSPFGFTGHSNHPATGLALATFRAYDPDIGRWIRRDPLGEVGGMNLYGYVGNSPIHRIDPDGLETDYFNPGGPFTRGIGGPWDKNHSAPASELIGGVAEGMLVGGGTGAILRCLPSAKGLVAASRGPTTGAKAFHHTADEFVESIVQKGLRPGSYATPTGNLSPLQAKIELALPGNLPRNAVLEIDLNGLRNAQYVIPNVTRVSSYTGMPGGGYEMQFPYAIPPEFLRVIQP